ncbi:MAG TPA: hypothetical protein VEB19_07110 [Gemmatimonadaceae bacterium]|nr:hypothetical protein [Gemmatimonadaceae bacterium]
MRDCRPRIFAALALASLLFTVPAFAQAGLSHLGDASLVPKGMLRLHSAVAWTRFDSQFGPNGVQPLGGIFTADSFGVRQLPRLAAAESLVREASDIPFSLTLGRSRLDATAREEVIPLALEYGLTDRLSIGVMVPFVRKRVAIVFRLDTVGGFAANAGPNRHRTDPTAAQNNVTLQAQFAQAAQQLQQRLTDCENDPGLPGCAALLPRSAEAQALIAESQALAVELDQLYGGTTSAGAAFVPLAGSAAQVAIEARIAALSAQYRDLLGAAVELIPARPFGAGGPAGVAQVQQFLSAEEGRDTIASRERVGIGDIELGFMLRVLSRVAATPRALGMQLALAGALRLPTGSDSSSSDVTDMRLGENSARISTRLLLDVSARRFGLLASGRFDQKLGTPASNDALDLSPWKSDSRIIEIGVAPRWHLSGPLAIHGAYSLRSGSLAGTDQLLGGGISFSNLRNVASGKTPPIEMRFTHLESISGDAGRPKFFRDQLELRIYYRLRR